MAQPLPTKLQELAILWNQLAGSGRLSEFRAVFLKDLEILNRMEIDYPDHPVDGMVALLEIKVLTVLNQQFRAGEIQQARRQLEKN